MFEVKKQTFSEMFSIYLDRRMFKILLLGSISGFPWVLIGSSLSLWLKEDGLSRSTIGWAGLIFGVYAFNYLWAPLVDRIQIPFLTKKIGHRRGWIVLMQLIILFSLIIWSIASPTVITNAKFSVGLIMLHKKRDNKINDCINTIHPLLWPIFFVKKGIWILSTKGAHK